MPIRWDTRNKRWRFEFDRVVAGRRHRASRLLPRGWTQAQADAFDRKEAGRLYAVAAGIVEPDPLVDQAVVLYARDKRNLKSYRATMEHLNAIAWAYAGRPMSELPAIAGKIVAERGDLSPGTIRNRLACLKAACRWAWKKHGLVPHDPTARMQLPSPRNERHVYPSRRDMLRAARACTHHGARVAIRVSFYSGLRLGELARVQVANGALVLADTKNGDRRAIPAHPRIRACLRYLPLADPKITLQRAWMRARDAVSLGDVHLHDLRHSAASEMVNAGVDLYTVGRVLGHRDPRSTARYSHLRHETLVDAVGKIGRKKA